MPKKTKKQKLRADERHVTHSSPTSSFTFEYQPTRGTSTQTHEDHTELAAIRGDLLRTIVLAAVAVTIEVGVYWRFFR